MDARRRLPADLEAMPVGAELFALLSSVDRSSLSEQDQVRLVRARHRLSSHVQGELFADLYAVSRQESPDEEAMTHGGHASRYPWSESEVAFALTWTHTAAGARLEQARQLVEELPQVQAALVAGALDVPKVLVICELASMLDDPPTVRRIVDQVLRDAPQQTTGQLRARLRRLVLAVDPDAARRRCATAVKTRRVEVFGNPDGTGELWGRSLPPQDAAAAWERLTAIAKAARAAGDHRTMDQLRTDAFLDLVVGTGIAVGRRLSAHTGGLPDADGPLLPDAELPDADGPPLPGAEPPDVALPVGALDRAGAAPPLPAPRRGVVELQVPLTTLMSLTQLPGDLSGFGPVVADVARQTADAYRDGTWRFSVYSEVGGLICHGITNARPARPDRPRQRRRRRPTADVAAFVRARNRVCVAPGCRRPARDSDLDHIVDWARGGESSVDNLDPKCALHHRYKHESGAQVIGLGDGVVAWRTPRGLQYVTAPDPPLLDDALFQLLAPD